MKTNKKILSFILACLLISCIFAGCSKQESNIAETITSKTMLIAYTEECAPFLYTDEATGKLTGFDAELVESTFESFKGEFKDYAFVKVDKDYKLGEDTCYTDEAGNEYSAIIMCGGVHKNTGTVNEDYNWSSNIIENKIITVVKNDSQIKSYNDLGGVNAAVVSDSAAAALNKNANIKNRLASATNFSNAAEAFEALENSSVNAVVIDSFDFYTYENAGNYTVLNGTLDIIEYGFGFSAKNDYSYGFNEAVKEMQSADYGNGDTLTPLVEKYFKSKDVCVFAFETEGDK